MEFKGFGDWIEIFRGGPQTDSRGRTHDGDAIIHKAVANFDPSVHEPPLVIGHPKDNAPAFGWVKGLKETANSGIKTLWGKFQQVVPQVNDAAKQGLYKKRSASFYPDGRLRHVGLLGAAPPAVKGLADLKFDDGEESLIFNDDFVGTAGGADTISGDVDRAKKEKEGKMEVKDFIELLKFWKEQVPAAQPAGKAGVEDPPDPQFTEADVEAAKKLAAEEAAKAEREKVETEFTEKARKTQREQREAAISEWCEQSVKEGRLTPALVEYGIPEMLSFMAANDDLVEFGEEKDKATMYDRFKGLFETELPKLVDFKELATREKDVGSGSAAAKLEKLIMEKQAANKELSYGSAFSEVQKENPDLVTEYQQEIKEVA